MSTPHELAESYTIFGAFLHHLRKRTQLTQRDLGMAVGYSVAQISLLENDRRLPDLTTLAALFIPALNLQDEPQLTTRLLEFAAASRSAGETTVQTRITRRAIIAEEIVESTAPLHAPHPTSNIQRLTSNLPAPLLPLIVQPGQVCIQTLQINPTAVRCDLNILTRCGTLHVTFLQVDGGLVHSHLTWRKVVLHVAARLWKSPDCDVNPLTRALNL